MPSSPIQYKAVVKQKYPKVSLVQNVDGTFSVSDGDNVLSTGARTQRRAWISAWLKTLSN